MIKVLKTIFVTITIFSASAFILASTCILTAQKSNIKWSTSTKAIASEKIAQTACLSNASNSMLISKNDENNGQVVMLNRGNSLQVSLASNPGTGYGWQLVANNTSQLKLLGNPVLEPPTNQNLNSLIYQVFRFQVQSAGVNVLELQYKRHTQSNQPPEKTYKLNMVMSNEPANLTVTDSDNNREVSAAKGDILSVRLPTNFSTGYGWEVTANNPNQLKLVGSPSRENLKESQPGKQEYQVFRFQVQSTGSSVLELQYRRTGITNSSPEKTYRIQVQTVNKSTLLRLTEADNGKEVRVATGSTLIVRLLTNPSTGFSWQVAQNNPDKLKPLGNPVLEQTGNQYKVFCFQGYSVGSSILEFHYLRPWERNQPPLNVYRLNVQIR